MKALTFLKRNKKIFVIVCLLLAAVLFALGWKGKQPADDVGDLDKPKTKIETDQEVQDIINDESVDQDIREILQFASGGEEPLESSYDKIREAFTADKITEERLVSLNLLAAFNPEDLPGEFKGAESEPGGIGINAELQWIDDNWDTFTDDKKEIFKPFFLDPDNEESFFHPLNKERKDDFLQELSIIPAAKAADWVPSGWKTVTFDAPGKPGIVTIYYFAPDSSSALLNEKMEHKAQKVKGAFQKAWPMYKNLLGVEPSVPFKVYLTTLKHRYQGSPLGLASWNNAHDNCEISIEENLIGKKLESVSVHELFHCFQCHIPLRPDIGKVDQNWLAEATAVWAEDYVYPSHNREHEYLYNFFINLDKERVFANEKREYGSYMLFFFLTKHWGNKEIIPTVLKKASGNHDKIREIVMNDISGFQDGYAEFALYNWNQKPWKVYEDSPSFPAQYHPTGQSIKSLTVFSQKKFDCPVSLNKGAMKYDVYYFDPDITKIKIIKFDLKGLVQDRNFQRQALIKIGDIWHIEDWNDIEKREFCREKPEENVKAIILIYSNSDLKNTKNGIYKLSTEGDCPSKRTGYTRITENYNIPGLKSVNIVFYSEDVVTYSPNKDAYTITSRKATCSYSDITQRTENIAGIFYPGSSVIGSGTLDETYSTDCPIRFELSDDRKSGSLFTDPQEKNSEWVTYTHNTDGQDSYVEKSDCGGLWSLWMTYPYELEPEHITSKGIKGKAVKTVSGATVTLEFEYELP